MRVAIHFVDKQTITFVNGFNYTNITNVDLQYYDNFLLVKSIFPEFKVSLAWDHLNPCSDGNISDPNPKQFANWWSQNKGEIINTLKTNTRCVVVELFDKNNLKLAEGDLLEFEEKYTAFEIELTVIPRFQDLFDRTITIDKNNNTRKWQIYASQITDRYSIFLRYFSGIPGQIFLPIPFVSGWGVTKNGKGVPVLEMSENIANHASNYLSLVYRNEQWSAEVELNNGRYTFEEVLMELALLYGVRAGYDFVRNHARFTMLNYNDSYTLVKGYLISENYSSEIKELPRRKLFKSHKLSRGALLTYYSTSFSSNWLDPFINNSLIFLRQPMTYEIWGFSVSNEGESTGAMLTPGQRIILNDEPSVLDNKYIIKEISYETETLDSIKSFKAVCVRVE